jgi:thiol-disulfide isomerase/thioredoxin
MRNPRAPVRAGIPALVVSAAILASGFLPGRAFGVEANQAAPVFSAHSLDGNATLNLAAYKGKVVFLDFWASWCGPCQTAMPLIESLRSEFPADQFQVLAVNIDEDPAKAKAFLESRKVKVGYPSVSDPEGRLPATYGLKTMPTSYLIDRSGVVRSVHAGFRASDVDGLRAEIRALLGTPPVPAAADAKR